MAIDNLQQFFEKLKVEIGVETSKYVYFSPSSGTIEKITNKQIELPGYEHLLVDSERVSDILSGKKRIIDFVVDFNLNTKQLELKEIGKLKPVSIIDKLYKIPKGIADPDLYITCYNDKWTIALNPKFREQYKTMVNVINNLTFNFSITDNNDPNVLHSSFVVQLYDLIHAIEIDITDQIKIPAQLENVSIYTFKYFDTYSCEIINE